MDQNQSVDPALSDEPGCYGSFSESSRSTEDTLVVIDDLPNGVLLDRPKLTIEIHFDRHTVEPLILNYRPNVVRLQKGHDVCQTTPRNGNVPGKILPTCDHARFCVGRKPHRLRLVELWILKCCQPEEPVQHGGRQALLLHIKKICADDCNGCRERPFNRPFYAPPRWWQGPGILPIFVVGNADADPDQIARALGLDDNPLRSLC